MKQNFERYWNEEANNEKVRDKFRSCLLTMDKTDLIKMIEMGINTNNMRSFIIDWGDEE